MTRPEGTLIGIIDDDPVMGGTLVHRLELEGYRVTWWQNGHQALEELPITRPDLVVSDIRLPDMSGEDVFAAVLPKLTDTPFLFVTAFGEIEQAVRLTKAGAVDYIAKPFAIPDLLHRIQRLIHLRPEHTEVLGRSPEMKHIETLLRRVADIDSSLLFTGESGSGKEVAARFAHQISVRADAPFMAVNCAAIPSELIESELFGHERGAFTGANTRHLGYVERAGNGTLFLDEVGDLPNSAQAKLLRLVQEHSFTRIGGESELKSAARIVCATNVDLEEAVSKGHFRRDLFFRINVIQIIVPPLRDRPDDILPLAHLFLRQLSEAIGNEMRGFSTTAEQALVAHSWPGNVRELRNRVERAVALGENPWIGAEALFPPKAEARRVPGGALTLSQARDLAERAHIEAALRRINGRVEEAARNLSVSRSTLFDKMRKLGISAEAQ